MSYCRCGPKFSFAEATKEPAPSGWQAKQVWCCGRCNQISHSVQEVVPVVRGPYDAKVLLHARGNLDGTQILTWAVGEDRRSVNTIEYRPYPRSIPMSEPEPLIFKLWELLQSKVSLIMDDSLNAVPEKEEAKYQARGISEALAILMKPFMESADDVVKAAVAYYKDNAYEVPGLGLHLWDPQINPDGTPRVPIAAPKTKPVARPKAPPTHPQKTSLKPEEITFAKDALASGMFSKEDLAGMFKVSLNTLESAIA